MEGNKPNLVMTAGVLRCAVWENSNSRRAWQSVQLTRRYKDKDGEWKSTNSLRVQDLNNAASLLETVYMKLKLKEFSDKLKEEGVKFEWEDD